MNEQLTLFQSPAEKPGPRQRHLQIGAHIVPYVLAVGGRRRLAMRIDERGLQVGSPRGMSIADIEAFVRSHGDWVIRKLDEYARTRVRRQIAIRDGQSIPVLGTEVEVRVVAGGNRVRWENGKLVLAARPDADLDALARRGLQMHAEDVFRERIARFEPDLGRPIPPLGLSSARTRWGSCSATGIRLNWRLVHLPLHLIDYVVAHELAHLHQMNHSPRFWAVVERLYPDWRAARRALKAAAPDMPLI